MIGEVSIMLESAIFRRCSSVDRFILKQYIPSPLHPLLFQFIG